MKYCRSNAEAPAAIGVAIEVPDFVVRAAGEIEVVFSESFCADSTLDPVVAMSGLILPSSVGPRLENVATTEALPCPNAPTVIAFLELPGEPIVFEATPSLPAANKMSISSYSRRCLSRYKSEIVYAPSPSAP